MIKLTYDQQMPIRTGARLIRAQVTGLHPLVFPAEPDGRCRAFFQDSNANKRIVGVHVPNGGRHCQSRMQGIPMVRIALLSFLNFGSFHKNLTICTPMLLSKHLHDQAIQSYFNSFYVSFINFSATYLMQNLCKNRSNLL